MWSSTAPVAITSLVAALRDAPGLSGVAVMDGPVVTGASLDEVVAVGFVGADDATAVTGTLAAEGLATVPNRETYAIQCAASVVNGAGDITAARSRVYELLAAVGAVLAADVTLGGTVMSAHIGAVTLLQSQTDRGAAATVVFSVDCDAYTVR